MRLFFQLSKESKAYFSVSKKKTINNSKLLGLIDEYSQYSPSPLSLRQFLDFAQKNGDEKASYVFLRQEVPTRLANMVKEMNRLPDSLLMMPSTKLVTSWYEKSFEEVISFQKEKPDFKNLSKFIQTMDGVIRRHQNVVETMAHGIIEWRESSSKHSIDKYREKVQYFLDRFYTSRIGIRILINQHTMLFSEGRKTGVSTYGAIDPNCNVAEVLEDSYQTAKYLCEQYYLSAPDVNIEVQNSVDDTNDKAVDIIYVPSHLHHICFELFKNAMRATMESIPDDVIKIPAINVTVTKGKTDCCIRISDHGHGASRQVSRKWFEYLYSTAPRPPRSEDARVTPLAGYGYGLPLSRLYARYLGGDLFLQSMEGYGTDAFIYLKTYSKEAVETVPVYNAATTEKYNRPALRDDWVIPAGNRRSREDKSFVESWKKKS